MTHPLIGKPLGFGPVEVTPESIAAFHRGINEDASGPLAHPMYCATVVIPGTGAILVQPESDFNVNRIVHGGIDMNFRAPIGAGDRLESTASLTAIEEKSSGRLLRVAFTVRRAGGDIAVDGESRYFIRGKKSDGAAAPAETESLPGTHVADEQVTTRKDQSLLYAEGSGDRFPIHTDDAFARSVGLPGVIMHGMCTLALSAQTVIAAALGGDPRRMKSLSCKFSQVVLPGETLRVQIRRTSRDTLLFETWNAAGKRAIAEGRVGH